MAFLCDNMFIEFLLVCWVNLVLSMVSISCEETVMMMFVTVIKDNAMLLMRMRNSCSIRVVFDN